MRFCPLDKLFGKPWAPAFQLSGLPHVWLHVCSIAGASQVACTLSHVCHAVLHPRREGMGRQEAEDLVATALALAMARDGSSGGVIR